jgi:hypothetical protein
MTNAVLLNNIDHKDLRIITTRSAAYGDATMTALTFPTEFRSIQAYYPIVFAKDGAGAFQPLALLGFEDGENLFLEGERWTASHVPLTVERQPFLIGVGPDGELTIHVDMDSPRVSTTVGEPVFLPHGGTTEFTDGVNGTLMALHEGLQGIPVFVQALVEYELIESFVLDVTLNNGTTGRLAGFYAINEDKLNALPGAAIEKLHRGGHLVSIYMIIASISKFRDLIERKNARHA